MVCVCELLLLLSFHFQLFLALDNFRGRNESQLNKKFFTIRKTVVSNCLNFDCFFAHFVGRHNLEWCSYYYDHHWRWTIIITIITLDFEYTHTFRECFEEWEYIHFEQKQRLSSWLTWLRLWICHSAIESWIFEVH